MIEKDENLSYRIFNVENKIKQLYSEALLHIIWIVVKHKDNSVTRNLVFAIIEFYPNELRSFACDEQKNKIESTRLFYQRVRIDSISDAIKLYRHIQTNSFIPVFWDEDGTIDDAVLTSSKNPEKVILCGNMQDVKVWPHFTLSKRDDDNGRPFIADSWDVCRTHQIFPEKREQFLLDYVLQRAVGEWLEQYLTWNISIFPELIGSVNLVLPNPYYRSKQVHMILGENQGHMSGLSNPCKRSNVAENYIKYKESKEEKQKNRKYDYVKIEFQKRSKTDVPELILVPFERTYFGVSGCDEYRISEKTMYSVTMPLSGRAEEFGFYVKTADEIIDFEYFGGFFKGFTLDIFTGYATKEVHRPEKPTKLIDVYDAIAPIKEITKDPEIDKRFHDAEILRLRNKRKKDSEFQLFYQDHEGAEAFLQEKISLARKSVMIVDPYYSTLDLLDYAVHVSVTGVEVTIITSADHLKSRSRVEDVYDEDNKPLIGDELNIQLGHYKDWGNGNLKIYVMTGDAAIHDRFLFVDDHVWFCGGSFNEVGRRLSCIIKIPEPEEMREQIRKILNSERVKTFGVWYQNWQVERYKAKVDL
ncbi:MAG: hypothetical protein J6H31_12785 [Butyrivibrio sp.]|nr:hypothetical protein [Butyrivibrio sp.]